VLTDSSFFTEIRGLGAGSRCSESSRLAQGFHPFHVPDLRIGRHGGGCRAAHRPRSFTGISSGLHRPVPGLAPGPPGGGPFRGRPRGCDLGRGFLDRDQQPRPEILQDGPAVSVRLAPHLQPDQVGVAESGIENRRQIEEVLDAGIWNFLIGESLVRSEDPVEFLGRLLGPSEES